MTEHPPKKTTEIHLDEDLIDKSTSYTNIAQEFIITTSDKIRLSLIENREPLKVKISWVAPTGILVALILTLVTTEFKKTVFGMKPEVWEALFMLSSFLCLLWLIYTLWHSWKFRGKGSVEDVIKKLKQS